MADPFASPPAEGVLLQRKGLRRTHRRLASQFTLAYQALIVAQPITFANGAIYGWPPKNSIAGAFNEFYGPDEANRLCGNNPCRIAPKRLSIRPDSIAGLPAR